MLSTRRISPLLFLLSCSPGTVKLEKGDGRADSGQGGRPTDDTGRQTSDTSAPDDSGYTADTGKRESGDTSGPVTIAVDLVNPSTGWEGDSVTIYGGPFDETVTAAFGGAEAPLQAWTDTTAIVAVPPGDEGVVDVAVSTAQGDGVLAGGFTYVRPCDGATVDPAIAYVGTDPADVTFTLEGCATGITVLSECTDSAHHGFYFTSVPTELDGEVEVVVHWTGWGTYDYGYCTLGLSTDQGEVWMTVQMR